MFLIREQFIDHSYKGILQIKLTKSKKYSKTKHSSILQQFNKSKNKYAPK